MVVHRKRIKLLCLHYTLTAHLSGLKRVKSVTKVRKGSQHSPVKPIIILLINKWYLKSYGSLFTKRLQLLTPIAMVLIVVNSSYYCRVLRIDVCKYPLIKTNVTIRGASASTWSLEYKSETPWRVQIRWPSMPGASFYQYCEKLPLVVIGRFKKPRCFKGINSLSAIYRANIKAWWLDPFLRNGFEILIVGFWVHHSELSSP